MPKFVYVVVVVVVVIVVLVLVVVVAVPVVNLHDHVRRHRTGSSHWIHNKEKHVFFGQVRNRGAWSSNIRKKK